MAMNLRLPDDEAQALRDFAEREQRSMNDVARQAISEFITRRQSLLNAAIASVTKDDAELLDRLSQ